MFSLLLPIPFAFIAVHIILVGLLRPRLALETQQALYAWGHVRGGSVLSLKFRYLFPWCAVPPMSSRLLWLLRAAQLSAFFAVVALAVLFFVGFTGNAA